MVSRYRERQYQLAAQKENETSRRYNYYSQTARYFERVCGLARQYDSWNYSDVELKEQLEKSRKAERLLLRRNKLRALLKEEEESYRKELYDSQRRKSRAQETLSLDGLREKLKEKRAEERLYLPRECRRLQSYFLRPTGPLNDPSTIVCRDTTNLLDGIRLDSRMSQGNDYDKSKEEPKRVNSRYLARYARRSLENTNVRGGDCEYTPTRRPTELSTGRTYETTSIDTRVPRGEQDKENRYTRSRTSPTSRSSVSPQSNFDSTDYRGSRMAHITSPEHSIYGHRSHHEEAHTSKEESFKEESFKDDSFKEDSTKHDSSKHDSSKHDSSTHDSSKHDSSKLDSTKEDSTKEDSTKEELPKTELPKAELTEKEQAAKEEAHEKFHSDHMCLYLQHGELNAHIEDLARKELRACAKRNWDDGIRFRDMRNRLELIREKSLYAAADLEIDEESRKLGLRSIDRREEELARRDIACADSSMYCEDAKALWKEWVIQDEKSAIKEADLPRDALMKQLEQEWKGLVVKDKGLATKSSSDVMNSSTLQEEHKLAAALSAAARKA